MDQRPRPPHRTPRPPGRPEHAALLAALVLGLGLGLAACDGVLPGTPDAAGDEAATAAAPEEAAPGGAEDDAAAAPEGEEAADAGEESAETAPSEGEGGAAELGAAAEGAAAEGAADGGAPGDMLSAGEAEDAAQMALEAAFVEDVVALAVDRDAVLTGQTGDASIDAEDEGTRVLALAERPSYRVVYSERYADKESEERAAQVGIYRYDTQQAVFAKVDLGTGDVEPLALPDGSPVPLVPEEIREATVVALEDQAVLDRLASAGIDPEGAVANGLLTTTDDASSPCATSRCVRLFFGTLDRPVPEFAVVVDLVALTVVEVADMPGRSLNP